jgi:phosphoribosylglycinamide formyltransferase-1
MSERVRAGILISGRGSNMEALISAAKAPGFPVHFVLVIADRPAEGLAKAEALGVPAHLIPWAKGLGETPIHDALTQARCEFVCLAGFMRLLSPAFVSRWKGRIVNIHPSLLPAFKGLDAIGQALAAGVSETGVTVHHVIPAMDEGPIILQQSVPVFPGDTQQSLAVRIHAVEHALYPAALRSLFPPSPTRS